MIRNGEQLAVVRSQLSLAEDALVSLHARVAHRNPRNYAIISEAYIDMILELRAEIDAYLGIAPRLAVPESEASPDVASETADQPAAPTAA